MALILFLFLAANICFKCKDGRFFDGDIYAFISLCSFYVSHRPAFTGRQVSQIYADKSCFFNSLCSFIFFDADLYDFL